jgi:nitric oxide reductase large subunit
MNEQKYTGPERRKQPDWMIKGSTILNVISWFLTAIAILIIDIASPNQENMFTHYFGGVERNVWNDGFILMAYITLVLSVVSCLTAFTFHIMRKRRKADKIKISIFVIGGITIAIFIIFVFRFGFQLF